MIFQIIGCAGCTETARPTGYNLGPDCLSWQSPLAALLSPPCATSPALDCGRDSARLHFQSDPVRGWVGVQVVRRAKRWVTVPHPTPVLMRSFSPLSFFICFLPFRGKTQPQDGHVYIPTWTHQQRIKSHFLCGWLSVLKEFWKKKMTFEFEQPQIWGGLWGN